MKTIYHFQKIVLTIIATIFSFSILAQDLRFSQPLANPLTLNPAMMGTNEDLKFILHYRSQWSALGNGYNTASFSVLYPIYIKEGKGRKKLDVGVNVLQDQAAAFKSLNASLAIGYNLQLSDAGHISFSVMGGYVQQSLNTSNLSFDNQYVLGSYSASNPNNDPVINQKVAYPEVGGGAMWYYNPDRDFSKLNAYLGVSGFHLNQPNQSFTAASATLPTRYSFQGGVKIFGNKKIDFTPNFIVNSQNGNENLAAGLLMDYHIGEAGSKLIVGAWYRRTDAIACSVGFEHKIFYLCYSYDVVTSKIYTYTSGLNAHEVCLMIKFNQSNKGSTVISTK